MSLRFDSERIDLRVEVEAVYGVNGTKSLNVDNRRLMRDRASLRALGIVLSTTQHEAIERFIVGNMNDGVFSKSIIEKIDDANCIVGIVNGIVSERFARDRYHHSQVSYPVDGAWQNEMIEEAYPAALAILRHTQPVTR